MDRAFSPRTVSMSQFLGLYPRLGLCAPLVLGRVQPPGLSKGHRSGWFEGQRPGTIPAYGIAIGFGHRNGWRAEGPVSFPVSLARTDGSGLQPSNRFNVPIPGAVPQAGIGCAVGAVKRWGHRTQPPFLRARFFPAPRKSVNARPHTPTHLFLPPRPAAGMLLPRRRAVFPLLFTMQGCGQKLHEPVS